MNTKPKRITYQDRVNRINDLDDLQREMKNAQMQCKLLRTKAKKQKTLDESLAVLRQAKEADEILYKLRINSFDIEDMILEKQRKKMNDN